MKNNVPVLYFTRTKFGKSSFSLEVSVVNNAETDFFLRLAKWILHPIVPGTVISATKVCSLATKRLLRNNCSRVVRPHVEGHREGKVAPFLSDELTHYLGEFALIHHTLDSCKNRHPPNRRHDQVKPWRHDRQSDPPTLFWVVRVEDSKQQRGWRMEGAGYMK